MTRITALYQGTTTLKSHGARLPIAWVKLEQSDGHTRVVTVTKNGHSGAPWTVEVEFWNKLRGGTKQYYVHSHHLTRESAAEAAAFDCDPHYWRA